MLKLYVWLMDLFRREEGQDLVEYALIATLAGSIIVVTVMAVLTGAFGAFANGIRDCITTPNSINCTP